MKYAAMFAAALLLAPLGLSVQAATVPVSSALTIDRPYGDGGGRIVNNRGDGFMDVFDISGVTDITKIDVTASFTGAGPFCPSGCLLGEQWELRIGGSEKDRDSVFVLVDDESPMTFTIQEGMDGTQNAFQTSTQTGEVKVSFLDSSAFPQEFELFSISVDVFGTATAGGGGDSGPPTSPIPLPAAGWLMLAGLGGLGGLSALRRRKRAA